MGINITQYRQAIGLFNGAKFVKTVSRFSISLAYLSVMLIHALLLIMLLSGDIETNPGPNHNDKISKLSLSHSNIRGLSLSKLRAIKTSLCDQFDILTFSETFLSSSSSHDLTLPGFHQIVRRDRSTFGGGVAVYIKENITFKRLLEFEYDSQLELIWTEIKTLDGKVLMCTVYRPPNDNEFWDRLEENIEHVKSVSKTQNMLILGDMNADFGTVNGEKLLDLCKHYNFNFHITEPTRITDTTRTCLDQILTNFPNFVCDSFVEPPVSTNDHSTVGIKLNFRIPKEYPYHRLIWQYSKGDYDGFRSAIMSTNWNECFVTDNIDIVCKSWTEKLLSLARAFIPSKKVLLRPNDKPWYNNNLRLLKRKVKRWYIRAKKTSKSNHWTKYKNLQAEYKKAVEQAELAFKTDLNERLCETRNTKVWWGLVKNILGKGSSDIYPTIEDPASKKLIYKNEEKANMFNEFFLSHNNIDLSNARLPSDTIGNFSR